jgi:hypothetical protein
MRNTESERNGKGEVNSWVPSMQRWKDEGRMWLQKQELGARRGERVGLALTS